MIHVYLFTDIPGSGKGWTLAVWAVSKPDAHAHVKAINGGGCCVGEASPGKVDAHCGTVTTRAGEEIKRKNEKIS